MNKNILRFSKNMVYKPVCTLTQYNNKNFRFVFSTKRQKGFENVTKSFTLVSTKEEINKAKFSRVKRLIREYSLCNDFNYFITLTIRDTSLRYDLDASWSYLRSILKSIKRKYNDFIYLIICEKHKNRCLSFSRTC